MRRAGGGGALRKSALRLEWLEAREVPAVNVWQGAADDFGDPDNWSDGVPTSDDILIFSGTSYPIDRFNTVSGSNQSVTFPTTADLVYAGIEIVNGYSGTVTFPANISFGTYTQVCGATAQSAGKMLTVTGTFSWTGGVVNNSVNLATYKFIGATGQIGTDDTDLSSGSSFLLGNLAGIGSYINQAGTLTLGNDSVVEVKAFSTFDQHRINAQIGADGPKVLKDGVGTFYLDQGRLFSNGGEVPAVKIEGGDLVVQGNGLKVTDKVPGSTFGVRMDGGRIDIRNGSRLNATHGVYMLDGELTTTAVANVFPMAWIEGALKVTDGNITIGTGNDATYSTLKVTGQVTLVEGNLHLKVDATNTMNVDNIQTDDKFDCWDMFSIVPHELNGAAPTNTQWVILESSIANGFVGAMDISVATAHQANWDRSRNGTTNQLYLIRK